MLRAMREIHIDKDFPEVPPPTDGAEFYGCTFHKLRGARLTNCVLKDCKFVMTKLEDIISVSLSFDCFTFSDLELSEEVFDALLLLICKSSGNTKKRRDIIENIVGHDRALKLLKEMKNLEVER